MGTAAATSTLQSMVDARKARDYMDDQEMWTGIILARLVESLATDQPGPTQRDVLLHMRSFIDGLLSEAEEAEAEADCAEEAPRAG